ncbi:hypothetical protein Xvie_01090 [Xenorhabdus vietnamensis]|uniref:Uncharacterized protein n=1 Tax=Xenorhabdus vietnamensis TaxID=351656 RepID=A0A1Y2SCB7_9GAMM|nr:hypothetical protein [Xenorhabdus vietnamensis]OTA15179.1 hypothetical protein Xvie_02985 [Xenorhabdus vietnamensis]OTA17246.1 hypothetical protein Xvie_01090 [Xenorhabdus vietnamensis]
MSYYDNFKRLDDLTIAFTGSTSNNAKIYGNGLNQVEIIVGVKIIDENDKPVTMTQDDLKNSIFLCDYTTGDGISNNGSSSTWNYSYNENDYTTAVNYSNASSFFTPSDDGSVGYNYLKLYIYSKSPSDGKVFAAGINIPTIGTFNTTKTGTNTPNGPNGTGSKFVKPANVTVSALTPYSYQTGDFSFNLDDQSLSNSSDQGAILYNVVWRNFYLDIQKEGYRIVKIESNNSSGYRFTSDYSGWWVCQGFDFSAEYGKGEMKKSVSIVFGKYTFGVSGNINRQKGICFSAIHATCTVPTGYSSKGTTSVTIYDQYGNKSKPIIAQDGDNLKIQGMG